MSVPLWATPPPPAPGKRGPAALHRIIDLAGPGKRSKEWWLRWIAEHWDAP